MLTKRIIALLLIILLGSSSIAYAAAGSFMDKLMGSSSGGQSGDEDDGVFIDDTSLFNMGGKERKMLSTIFSDPKSAIENGQVQLMKVDPRTGIKPEYHVKPLPDGKFELVEEGEGVPVAVVRIMPEGTGDPWAPYDKFKEDTLSTGGLTTQTCGHDGLKQWDDDNGKLGGDAKAWQGSMDGQDYMYYRHPMETKSGSEIRTIKERLDKYASTYPPTYAKCMAIYDDSVKCDKAAKWHSCRVPGSILEPFLMTNRLPWAYDKNEPVNDKLAYTYDSPGKKYNDKGFTSKGLSWFDSYATHMPPPYNPSTYLPAPTYINKGGSGGGNQQMAMAKKNGKYANSFNSAPSGDNGSFNSAPGEEGQVASQDWEPWRAQIVGSNCHFSIDGANGASAGVKNHGAQNGEWEELKMVQANTLTKLGGNFIPNYCNTFYAGSSAAFVQDLSAARIPLDLPRYTYQEIELQHETKPENKGTKYKNYEQEKQIVMVPKNHKGVPNVVTWPYGLNILVEGGGSGGGGSSSSSSNSGGNFIGVVKRSVSEHYGRYLYNATQSASSSGGNKPKGLKFPGMPGLPFPCKAGEEPKGNWPGGKDCKFMKQGLGEARAGNWIIWDDKSPGNSKRLPIVRLVQYVLKKDGKTCITSVSANDGVIADANGVTENWGRASTKEMCDKAEEGSFALKGNKKMPGCIANPQAERCHEKPQAWKKWRVYDPLKDTERRIDPKTGEMKPAGECKSLTKRIEKGVDKIRGKQKGGKDDKGDKPDNDAKKVAGDIKKAISLGCLPPAKFKQPYAGERSGSRVVGQYAPMAPGESIKQVDYVQKGKEDSPFKMLGNLPIPSLFGGGGGGNNNQSNNNNQEEKPLPKPKTCGQTAIENAALMKNQMSSGGYSYKEGCAGGSSTPGNNTSCNGKQLSREGFIYSVYGGYSGGLGNLAASTPSGASSTSSSILAYKNIHDNSSKEPNGCRITNLSSCAKAGDVVLVQIGSNQTSDSSYNRYLIYAGGNSFYEAQPNGSLIRYGSLPAEYTAASYEVRRLSCNN